MHMHVAHGHAHAHPPAHAPLHTRARVHAPCPYARTRKCTLTRTSTRRRTCLVPTRPLRHCSTAPPHRPARPPAKDNQRSARAQGSGGSRAGQGTRAGARFEYTCPPLTRRLIGGFALERSCSSSPHRELLRRDERQAVREGKRAPPSAHAGRSRARRRGRHPPRTTGDGCTTGGGRRRRPAANLGPFAANPAPQRSRPKGVCHWFWKIRALLALKNQAGPR